MAKLGLMLESQENLNWDRLLNIAEKSEQLGFESLFLSDHLTSVKGHQKLNSVALWPALTAVAMRTNRIRLGSLVCSMTFRHPAQLAKMSSAVDVLSAGRFGLTARLMDLYSESGESVVGSDGGVPDAFYQMLESVVGEKSCVVVIIVSDEASDYREEMSYLAHLLSDRNFPVYALRPQEVIFKEEGLFFIRDGTEVKVDVLYRFFELFDLKNIPKAELMMYSQKKGRVKITPPYKPNLTSCALAVPNQLTL